MSKPKDFLGEFFCIYSRKNDWPLLLAANSIGNFPCSSFFDNDNSVTITAYATWGSGQSYFWIFEWETSAIATLHEEHNNVRSTK